MSDEAERRDRRSRFEPPPWEQAQFEELARRRAEETRAAEAAARAEETTPVVKPGQAGETTEERSRPVAEVATAAPEKKQGSEDDPRVVAMMAELSGHERSAAPPVRVLGRVLAVVLGVAGVALLVAAVVVAAKLGEAAGPVAAGPGLGGLLALGGAALLWMRAVR